MYFKVMKNDEVVDVLDRVVYLKYQEKHGRMLLCDISEAQAICSSDGEKVWHEESLYNIPVHGYETVRIEEIDEFEYKRLKVFNGQTPEEILDRFTMRIFIDKETGLLVESLKRLYGNREIEENTAIEVCKRLGIADEEIGRIFE